MKIEIKNFVVVRKKISSHTSTQAHNPLAETSILSMMIFSLLSASYLQLHVRLMRAQKEEGRDEKLKDNEKDFNFIIVLFVTLLHWLHVKFI